MSAARAAPRRPVRVGRRLPRGARDLRRPDRRRLASAAADPARDRRLARRRGDGRTAPAARVRGRDDRRRLLLPRDDDRRHHLAPALVAPEAAATTRCGMSRPEVDGLNTGYAALLLEQYLDNPSAVPDASGGRSSRARRRSSSRCSPGSRACSSSSSETAATATPRRRAPEPPRRRAAAALRAPPRAAPAPAAPTRS